MYVDQSQRSDSFSQEFDKHAGLAMQGTDKTMPILQIVNAGRGDHSSVKSLGRQGTSGAARSDSLPNLEGNTKKNFDDQFDFDKS